jgi:nitrogen fixation/metabolism regulation signal transduction histidine kinase
MRVLFYQNVGSGTLIDPSGKPTESGKLSPVIRQAITEHKETSATVNWTSDSSDDEVVHAIPLSGDDNRVLGVLLASASRRPYLELRRHIGSAALLAAGSGLVLAILFGSWAAARVTRPVVQLAETAREVAAGNWYAQADVTSSDELGELAESFNRMTRDLLDQRERLVQTERVAAWRELARRLAHELKNPLFPLQLTVENLLRSRQQSPEQFEEIFQESSATLLAEIANLRTVIGRFSDFARMPQPQLQLIDLNDIARGVMNLFQAQCGATMECKLELADGLPKIEADPELLHRAISNLVLNAMDAMPQGGILSIVSRRQGEYLFLSVADTGTGLTPEECERIFTPYYTSKTHGTGLGLAIVQSVISDHHGRVSVKSKPGGGTTFTIELPLR